MEGLEQFLTQVKVMIGMFCNSLVEVMRALQPGLKKVALVMVGGGLGAASRYGISIMAAKLWGTRFPWGTLLVNLTGCFLIGFLFVLATRVRFLGPDLRLLLIAGYLGSLTTFSTFAIETIYISRSGTVFQPLANILLNNLGSLGCALAGMWLGNQLFKSGLY